MGCAIRVKADNGKDSRLFATLAVVYGDTAMDKYLEIMANKSRYALDENGEPTFESISKVHSAKDLFAPALSHSPASNSGRFGPTVAEERFDALVKTKEQIMKRQNKWAAELEFELAELEKSGNQQNAARIQVLYKSIYALRERIANTKEDIDKLRMASQAKDPAEMIFRGGVNSIVRRDMNRIAKLANSGFTQDLSEAKDLINLYEAIGDFENVASHGHILFMKNEVLAPRTGQLRLSSAYRAAFEATAAEATAHKNVLDTRLKNILTNIARNNALIRKTFGADVDPAQFEQLINFDELTKDAPDLNAIHSMMLDPEAGNPVLAKLMVAYMVEENEKAWSEAQQLINNINQVVKAAEKELPSGTAGVGVRFDPFRQKYVRPDNGERKETGHLITRFSADFDQARRHLVEWFHGALEAAAVSPNKRMLMKQAFQKRNRWYKANLVMLDPNKIASIVADTKFSTVRKGVQYTPAEMQAHYDELKRHLGSDVAVEEYVQKSRKQLNQYIFQLEVVKQQISTSPPASIQNPVPIQNWTTDMRDRLEKWEMENNPFLIPDQDGFVSLQTFKNTREFIKPSYETFAVSVPRRYEAAINIQGGKYVVTDHPSNKETPWYDPDFKAIEGNKALFDFYNVLIQTIETVNKALPPELQRMMESNSLIAVKKSLMESFIADQGSGSYLEALSIFGDAGNKLIDFVRNTASENHPGDARLVKNPVTGEMEDVVNSSFLGSRKQEVAALKSVLRIEWEQQNGTSLPRSVAMEHEREAENQIARKYSFDVTKVLQMYAVLGLQYAHREKVVPVMNVLKQHYTSIQKPKEQTGVFTLRRRAKVTPESAERMLRARANEQMEDWYKRAVLGDYSAKDEAKTNFKIAKSQDAKEEIKKIDALIANETDRDKLAELASLKASLERKLTGSGVGDMFLHILRLKGMGWNLPAVPANIMAGTVMNLAVASDGRSISWDNMWRSYSIVLGNILKNLTFGKVATDQSVKNRFFMDKYRVLQDATNEFQKASQASKVTSKFEPLNPFTPVQQGEFINQSVLMMGLMMNTPITGVNGEQSNVWDASNPDGTLKPEFDNQQNRENWVMMTGQDYRIFKIALMKLIVQAHGDYNEMRGMSLKRNILGRALLTFRTWLARAFYTRMGGIETDIELGYVTKGRYRSHTPGSGMLAGALQGTVLLPVLGTVVGGAVGYGLAKFYGVNNSGMSLGEELTFTTKQLIRKLMFKNTEFDSKYNDVDAANMRANFTELAILAALFTTFIMAKAVLWDDDDEKDDPRRKAHNLIVNNAMRMMGDLMMFSTPHGYQELQENFVPAFSLLKRYEKFIEYGLKRMNNDHIIPTGYNAGEDGFMNAFEDAFLPNIFKGVLELKPTLGFKNPAKRQFQPSPWDRMFYSEEKIEKKRKMQERAKKRRDEEE